MIGVNKVILLGNVGKDPEIQHLEGGVSVARFPVATTESYKDKNGNKIDQTEWHNIVAWRGLADVTEKIVHKGSQLYIEGRLRTRQWEDKEKNKRYTTEIVADVITVTGGRKTDGTPLSTDTNTPSSFDLNANDGNDLPF